MQNLSADPVAAPSVVLVVDAASPHAVTRRRRPADANDVRTMVWLHAWCTRCASARRTFFPCVALSGGGPAWIEEPRPARPHRRSGLAVARGAPVGAAALLHRAEGEERENDDRQDDVRRITANGVGSGGADHVERDAVCAPRRGRARGSSCWPSSWSRHGDRAPAPRVTRVANDGVLTADFGPVARDGLERDRRLLREAEGTPGARRTDRLRE